jgi:type IV secretion system protein VirB7
MNRIAMLILVAAATGLGGCTSVLGPTPAPSCDGGARRPLNRSMWDWEAARPVASAPSPIAADAGLASEAGDLGPARAVPRRDSALPPRGRPVFDLAASLQPCLRRTDHG